MDPIDPREDSRLGSSEPEGAMDMPPPPEGPPDVDPSFYENMPGAEDREITAEDVVDVRTRLSTFTKRAHWDPKDTLVHQREEAIRNAGFNRSEGPIEDFKIELAEKADPLGPLLSPFIGNSTEYNFRVMSHVMNVPDQDVEAMLSQMGRHNEVVTDYFVKKYGKPLEEFTDEELDALLDEDKAILFNHVYYSVMRHLAPGQLEPLVAQEEYLQLAPKLLGLRKMYPFHDRSEPNKNDQEAQMIDGISDLGTLTAAGDAAVKLLAMESDNYVSPEKYKEGAEHFKAMQEQLSAEDEAKLKRELEQKANYQSGFAEQRQANQVVNASKSSVEASKGSAGNSASTATAPDPSQPNATAPPPQSSQPTKPTTQQASSGQSAGFAPPVPPPPPPAGFGGGGGFSFDLGITAALSGVRDLVANGASSSKSLLVGKLNQRSQANAHQLMADCTQGAAEFSRQLAAFNKAKPASDDAKSSLVSQGKAFSETLRAAERAIQSRQRSLDPSEASHIEVFAKNMDEKRKEIEALFARGNAAKLDPSFKNQIQDGLNRLGSFLSGLVQSFINRFSPSHDSQPSM